ncbi:aspartate-semialdehyde dehydrogenase [Neptunomonas japonica]|uniref:Aspartate-semialdehyde dehydrogenase n=1 Tax=Neptunomonas japonica JAMM 1380 TaxID=1441457 RepID=A0A7R6SVH5_9GAMM|nr:aspartate-semialdehyde dehydrogenase [Neptunomonas japonica]BBB29425.1 aspartate-semialdehyde dehydrogenase [Neptunomonas japonica JAMM 1380]
MDRVFDVVVVGATGLVGENILSVLEERAFPIGNVYLLASERSTGTKITFKGQTLTVQSVVDFDFSQAQIAFFSASEEVAIQYAPIAADAGCVVIDTSSAFCNDPDVPLVIPEVNAYRIADFSIRNMISIPDAPLTQLLLALAPIHRSVGIDSINVSTYQAVSGVGRKGVGELAKQTTQLLNAKEIESHVFSKQIAFNVVPHAGNFLENGYTQEEMNLVLGTQKILDDPSVRVNPTCVRVPVFFGHSESVSIETQAYISADEVTEILQAVEGVDVIGKDHEMDFTTPVTDAAGSDVVYVSRVREDLHGHQGISLWITADNVKKGSALSAVQVAELVINDYL